VITFTFFLIIGAALLLSLFLLARGTARADGAARALVDAKQALQALQGELLPPGLVERIFTKHDFNFVTSSTPRHVQVLFMAERKKVAVCWAQQVHAGVLRLMNFHVGQARFYTQLSLATEIKLAMNFAALLLACRIMQVALYVGGPYAVPGMIERTVGTAGRLCEASEKALAFLEPSQGDELSKGSARDSAVM